MRAAQEATTPRLRPVPDPEATRAHLAAVKGSGALERHPYAAAAVAAELARLGDLARPWHEGARWDSTTYEVACCLIELANSEWSGFELAEVEAMFYANAPSDDVWGHVEHRAKWASASATVGGQGRPEPPEMPGGFTVEEVAAAELVGAQIEAQQNGAPDPEPLANALLNEPLDWAELFATEDEDEEWIAYPFLPARRTVALYSAPKAGKSLLMLEMAVDIARGKSPLGYSYNPRPASGHKTADKPRPASAHKVAYIDFENDPRGDIRSRLIAMGYTKETAAKELANLVYFTFPNLAKLDTAAGASDLVRHCITYECDVVVIDTISRAIGGEENDNDTWLSLYRHTGLALKKAGIACIRLDHSGKDVERGMRGGSAKYGDVDAVWKLTPITETMVRLECTDHRFPLTETEITLTRESDPLHHRVAGNPRQAVAEELSVRALRYLESRQVPVSLGVRHMWEDYAKADPTRPQALTRGVLQRAQGERKAAAERWAEPAVSDPSTDPSTNQDGGSDNG